MLSRNSYSQFSGSNQVSFQVGNQPHIKPTDQSSLYNQLNIRYNQEHFTLGLRAEMYQINTPAEYNSFSQKFVRYKSEDLYVQLGNFNEIFGKGLLLRSFEIPGSIYEVYGQRYGFYKDIEGLSIRYQTDYINAKFVYGRPLDRSLPPSFSKKERRPTLLQGAEIDLPIIENVTPGLIYLKSSSNNTFTMLPDENEYFGLKLDALFSDNIQFYSEYAAKGRGIDSGDLFDDSRGFYTSASIGLDWVYITGEYKYYNDFTLVYNDPPPGVREHSFLLLNRSTHVINLANESGYQLELLFNLDDSNTITFNHAYGTNDFAASNKTYQSYYLDLSYYLKEQTLLKTFVDFSIDESEFQYDRYTLGAMMENPVCDLWSMSSEIQYQQYNHDLPTSPLFGNLDQNIKNIFASLVFNYSPTFSVGSAVELSNDNSETDPNLTGRQEVFISWPSLNLSYQYNQQNIISFFYGKRRGGNACTGGVCYQVLPFEGLELRLNSSF
jgi:Family of unknown function (DUF6029)